MRNTSVSIEYPALWAWLWAYTSQGKGWSRAQPETKATTSFSSYRPPTLRTLACEDYYLCEVVLRSHQYACYCWMSLTGLHECPRASNSISVKHFPTDDRHFTAKPSRPALYLTLFCNKSRVQEWSWSHNVMTLSFRPHALWMSCVMRNNESHCSGLIFPKEGVHSKPHSRSWISSLYHSYSITTCHS